MDLDDDGLTSDEKRQIAAEVAARHGSPKYGTPAWQIAHLEFMTSTIPIREVGIAWWFLVHKTALLRAMRTCGVRAPGMSSINKKALIRLCMPILRADPSPERTSLLAAIRREADAHEIAVRDRPLRNLSTEETFRRAR
jgi:hypothetical protein